MLSVRNLTKTRTSIAKLGGRRSYGSEVMDLLRNATQMNVDVQTLHSIANCKVCSSYVEPELKDYYLSYPEWARLWTNMHESHRHYRVQSLDGSADHQIQEIDFNHFTWAKELDQTDCYHFHEEKGHKIQSKRFNSMDTAIVDKNSYTMCGKYCCSDLSH